MLRRLLVGLFIGLVVGAVLAFGVVQGLHMATFVGAGGAALAYLAAAVTGVLTGLVAGKPIWSSGGKIEAGLKAIFGALLAAGGMFALRTWATGFQLDMTALGAGHDAVGNLPAASLPIIAAVLGGFFELDNTGPSEASESKDKAKGDGAAKGEKKPAAAKGKSRVADGTSAASPRRGQHQVDEADGEAEEVEAQSKRAKR